MKNSITKKEILRKIIFSAIISAIAIVLIPINFPIFPFLSFLKFDFADMPVLILSFICGPTYAFASMIIVSVYQALFLSADGWIGGLMHIVASGTLVVTAGLIYHVKRTKSGAIVALTTGIVSMCLIMIPFNYILTPIFMNVPRSDLVAILPWFVLFNFIKSSANSLLTFFSYRHIKRFINENFYQYFI